MFDSGIVLFPLPALRIPFAGSGLSVPVLVPSVQPYAVNGAVLPDQPSLRTAPLVSGRILASGSIFTLLFSSPSPITQSLLADGSQVTLRFGLADGGTATGSVQLTSNMTGNMFQVTCTLLSSVSLSFF